MELARLLWNARRGMKELDIFLIPFIKERYHKLTKQELKILIFLLEQPDPDLYNWLMGYNLPSFSDLEYTASLKALIIDIAKFKEQANS